RAHPCTLAHAPGQARLRWRGGPPLCLRGWPWRGGIHLLGHAALLRRLLAGAAVLRWRVLHLPVRAGWCRPARTDARRLRRREPAAPDPRHLDDPRGPLLRAAGG